jgi:hypothetical protein
VPKLVPKLVIGPTQVLLVFLLPATAAGMALLLGAVRAPAGGWIGALGVGVGFLLGHYGLLGRLPPLVPHDATQALFHAVLGTSLAACFDTPRRSGLARLGLRAAVSALAPLLYLKNRVERWEPAEILHHVGALTLAIFVLWYGLDLLARRRRGPSLALVLWLAAAGTSAALMLGRFAINAELAGTLAAILGAAVVVGAMSDTAALEGGALGVVSVTLVLLAAGGVHLSNLPPAAGLALVLAPLAVWPAELWTEAAPPRRAALLRLAFVAVPVGFGLWLAWAHRPGLY